MPMFLVNPPTRRKGKRRAAKGRGPLFVFQKHSKRRKVRRHTAGRSKARRVKQNPFEVTRRKARSKTMAKRKKARSRRRSRARRGHRTVMRRNPPRRKSRRVAPRKRRYALRTRGARRRHRVIRTNPPKFSLNNIKSMVIEGSKDAVGVIAGQTLTRVVTRLIPFDGGMPVQVAKGVVAALVSSYGVSMLSPRMGRMALAGGLSEVVRPLLAQVPGVGGFISGEDYLGIGAYAGMGAYPAAATLSAYEPGDAPQMSGADFLGVGDDSGY